MRISDWRSDVCSSDIDIVDHRAVATRVDEVLDHKDRMAAIRKKARSTIVQRYELERCLDEQLKLVAALVGGKRPLAGGTPGKPDYRLPKEAQPTPAQAKKTAATKRSEAHTSELQSLLRLSYAVFCL